MGYEIGHAIENYTTAIRFNPRFTEAYFNRGTAYCQKGEFGLAIEDYNEAIQINPSFVTELITVAPSCGYTFKNGIKPEQI